MATATFSSDLAIGIAEKMAQVVEKVGVEELNPEQASTGIRMCGFLQELFAQARRSIEEGLSAGVDAREFAAKYERGVIGLEAIMTMTQQAVTKARTSQLSPAAEQFVSSYRASMDEMRSLHQFLVEALAKAKLPARPIDWNRVQEAEAAFARGETKPLQRSPKRQAGK
jgi:hypothetical protein